MEQKNITPNPLPEAGSYMALGGAQQAERQLSQPGSGLEYENNPEQIARNTPVPQGPMLPAPQGPPVPTQAPVSPLRPTTASTMPTNGNPLLAGDEDVIEKEWVDKAKKIVAQTKNDPREQEREVSKLQADYLKKRYGKEIKLVSD